MGRPQLFDPEELEAAKEDSQLQEETQETEEEQEETVEAQGPVEDSGEPNEGAETYEIPEKYVGKSVAELVKMHQEAEKAMGKQSGEVGQLRQLVDQYIQSQTVAQAAQQTAEEDDDDLDFYTDPEKAVSRAIDKHPKIREADLVTQQYRKSSAMSELQQRHPDFKEIVAKPEFAEWVQKKPGLTEMFLRADQQYDVEAGDTLLSLWKERASVAQQTAAVEKQARKQAAKAASTGNTQSSPDGTSRKKIYRRADIINLINTDPDRYQAMSDEIMKAYAEGRVK
jgi:hypothetical protein